MAIPKLVCTLFVAFVSANCFSQELFTELHKIRGVDLGFEEDDIFAQSIATDGNLLVAGSIHPGVAVHVFDAKSGSLIHVLRPDGIPSSDRPLFGSSVAVDGNYVVVGDRGD